MKFLISYSCQSRNSTWYSDINPANINLFGVLWLFCVLQYSVLVLLSNVAAYFKMFNCMFTGFQSSLSWKSVYKAVRTAVYTAVYEFFKITRGLHAGNEDPKN